MSNRRRTAAPLAAVLACALALVPAPRAPGADPAGKPAGNGKAQNPVAATSKRYESFERKLASFRSLPDNATAATQVARTLLQMGKSAPPALGGLALEAACAAFIACGADASYADARKALGNPKEFESSVLFLCPDCGGTGRSSTECRECHGSGRCPIPSCNGGRRYVPKLGVVACPTCKGTARCQDCKGTGRQAMRCPPCGGAGRKIDRDAAQALFRERIDAAVAECRKHEVVPVSGAAGSGTTLAKATATALVAAVRQVHGPGGAERQRLLGPGDKSIVKDHKITSKGEDESGLFLVKADVLVAKVLPGMSDAAVPPREATQPAAEHRVPSAPSPGPAPAPVPPRRVAPAAPADPWAVPSDDPFADDPWN